ncbi:DUF4190 domain-containing protein [Aporhodopirellula aestuarii]|uniref:DUF4190 domain-containing protein n=1 Tax=Aporhodopirellula aestuarii TaxID=2950107 RepID=A0ABT0U7X8_9BACT|nr:DUF4190 domain-containing protein [Aporhodopirellula aestuarii]MCM2373040.1 DUF4190 domain-containing protein [Aporhodopirellula aestuarii]
MSDEVQPFSTPETVDFPYRAISRGAIWSIVFFVVALAGIVPTFAPMLILAVPGIFFAAFGLRSIKQYPEEFSGRGLAMFGLIACSVLFIGGVGQHTYIYLTEVPEGYERVPFYKLQADTQGADQPTETALAIDGKPVFLKGYIHPSSGSGMLRQFILVPDLGTCCFGGQPRSSDMIEVNLPPGNTVRANVIKRKLAGTFQVNRMPQKKSDFDNALFYKMRVDQFK